MMKKLILVVAAAIAFPTVTQTAFIQTELSYNPRNAKGTHPFVSYLPGIGQINLVNVNLAFGRPLVFRPGRAGFDLNLSLVYNSKLWDRSGAEMRIAEPGSWTGLGWRFEFPKLRQGSSTYALISSDGASHEIADHGGGDSPIGWRGLMQDGPVLPMTVQIGDLRLFILRGREPT